MPTDDAAAPVHRTSPALLILAWLVVGIPAAWGVTQTVKRSMDLFRSPPPPAVTTPTMTLPIEFTPPTTTTTATSQPTE